MAKILLIVAIVVSAATAVLGFMNQSSFKETKAELATTQGSLATAKKSLADTTTKLKESEELATGLQADKEQLTSSLAESEENLSAANQAKTELEAQIEEQTTQIADLNDELEKLRNLPQGGDGSPEQVAMEDPRVAELEASVNSLSEQLNTSKAQVASLEEKEQARQSKIMKKGLQGQVLAVNPAWNFVVLSIGDRQGVVNNAELLLTRGNQYLGKVRVTSVEPQTSIADIVANTLPTGVSVQPGDSVIYQSSGE